jgi:hypothetical protein
MLGKLALGVTPEAGGSESGSLPGAGAGTGAVEDATGLGLTGAGAGAALQASNEQLSKLAKRFTACLLW